MISLGKNTFVTRFWLPTTLWPADPIALAKNVQGNRPAKTNNGYGTSVFGADAIRPKNRLKTTIIASGWRTAQATPSTVCLYRTLTSRHVRKNNSSR